MKSFNLKLTIYRLQDLLDEDVNSLVEEEDCVGCPLPSTPEDENLLDSEVKKKKEFYAMQYRRLPIW